MVFNLLLLSAVRAMGGQAVLNGVMMRGETKYSVACRRMDDSIDIKTFDVPSFASKFVKIPFLRGVMGLGEAMALGYRSLMHSADLAMIDEEAKERLEKAELENSEALTERTFAGFAGKSETESEDETSEFSDTALPKSAVAISVTISICFFVGLFILSPLLIGRWIENALDLSKWQGFVLESGLRLVIFLSYLFLVSLIPDIKRVFQYHGAEHKAIAAYENDVVLTPKSAQQFKTAHVRCGTNFLLIVMVMSIVFYAAIAAISPDLPFWALLLSRIIVIPLIAGVSYEIIRGAATRMKNPLVRVLIKPGLWLQKVTTRAPSDEQCEVAIASLMEVFSEEQLKEVNSRDKEKAKPSWQILAA